ncbi:MAG: hypothetical protein AMJ56_14025 [Anaerolineae bacterium SG8_19]|nr:MAG: hypothetical protein AMJ56_14025 [Anaerolineae bacterium SG8_19]
MPIFGNRLKNVTTKVWDATHSDFAFPEIADPEIKVAGLTEKPNLGLAISGGGTRSASATLGQLRGLNELGILQKARYLSCVSGSSFTSTAFCYLPAGYSDSTFLGPIVKPQNITAEHLNDTVPNSFAHTIANSFLMDDYLKNAALMAGDETYSRAIGDVFLKPFGLDSPKRFFSQDERTVATILEHNSAMKASDFYLVRSGRPFPIISAIILRPDNGPPLPKKMPVETTSLYTGVRPLFRGAGRDGRDIGGGYVEPFAFDSTAPGDPPNASGRVTVRLGSSRHRYTLSDAIGTSGAAPAESMVEDGLTFLGFPEYRYWPVSEALRKPAAGRKPTLEYEFGDGGNLENLSIMPLLARQVERIIIFVNTRQPVTGDGPGQINRAIPPVFGLDPAVDTNTVFPAGKCKDLVAGLLAAKRAGTSVIHHDWYQVQENAFFGIKGGWEVEVLWVYNERVPAWEKLLSGPIRQMIGRDSLVNFPHYKTYGQNKPAIIDLKPEQVFLLANLSCWNVLDNAALFLAMLG